MLMFMLSLEKEFMKTTGLWEEKLPFGFEGDKEMETREGRREEKER